MPSQSYAAPLASGTRSKTEGLVQIGSTGGKALVFVGFACYCAMLRPPFFGSLATDVLPDPKAMRVFFDIVCMVIGILFMTAPGIDRRIAKSALSPAVLRPLSLLASIGVILICSGRQIGISAPLFYNAGSLILGIGFSALTACWFSQLSHLPRRQTIPYLLGAFVASHLFGVLDLLPRETSAIISVLYPIASLASLMIASRSMRDDSGTSQREPSDPNRGRFFKWVRILALAVVFMEVLCGAFLRSAYSRGGINYIPGINAAFTYVISLAIGIALLLISRRAKNAAECTLAVGGTGLVGFALISFLLDVVPLGTLIPYITGLYSVLIVFMMALILLWHDDGDRETITCAGAFLLLHGSVSSITASVIPALFSFQGRMPSEYLAPIGALAGIAIAFGIAIVLAAMIVAQRKAPSDEERTILENRSNAFAGTPPKSAQPESESNDSVLDGASTSENDLRHERAVLALAERYNLTERERQTASLVAKGYTAKRVAKALTVATSTVQGYSKSIYRKMGIHRKDELIEAVRKTEQNLDLSSNEPRV